MDGGGTITFSNDLDRRRDAVTLEEFFHAYQHDNRDGYGKGEFNREFEAKTFVVSAALGAENMTWGYYEGMNDIINPIINDHFRYLNYAISPSSVHSAIFLSLYGNVANKYGMFNATQNIGNVNYKRKTKVSPYSLQKVITDTFLKPFWQ